MTSGKVPPQVPQRFIQSQDAAPSALPAAGASRASSLSNHAAADAPLGPRSQAVVDEVSHTARARSASAPGESAPNLSRPALPPRPPSSNRQPPIPAGYGPAVAPQQGARRPPPIPAGYGAAQDGPRRAPPPPPPPINRAGIASDAPRRPPPIVAPLPGLPTPDGEPAGLPPLPPFAMIHKLLAPGSPAIELERAFPPPMVAASTASPARSDASTLSARSDASTPSATLPGLPRSQSTSSFASMEKSPSWLDRALRRTRVSVPTVRNVVQQAGSSTTEGIPRVAPADAKLAQLDAVHREKAEKIRNYSADMSRAIDDFRAHADLTASGLFRLTAQHPQNTESHERAHAILQVTRSTAMFSDEMRIAMEAQQAQSEEFAAPLIQQLRPDKRESFEKLLDLCVDLVANHVNTGSFDDVKAKRDALTATSRYFPRLAPEREHDLAGDARFLSGKFAQFMQAAILLRARSRNPELHAILTGTAPQQT